MFKVPFVASSLPSDVSLSAVSAQSHTRIVLIASSDDSLRERLRQALLGLRWRVVEASSGASAAWEASQVSHLEALLIDPWLPDLQVQEFLGDFNRDFPRVDLIMTDGSSPDGMPRSPYRQEILYALRRSQEVDTAIWNTAFTEVEEPVLSSHESRLRSSGRSGRQEENYASTLKNEKDEPSLIIAKPWGETGPLPSEAERQAASFSEAAAPFSIGGTGDLLGSANERSQPEKQTAKELANKSALGAGPSVPPTKIDRIPELIGESTSMLEVSRRIRLVAARSTPVLIEGPTGSGKEVVAEALHRLSKRSRKPLVTINCAAIPEALLEAELFGHTRGAFTGAVQGRIGRIEAADGGTLFLDEIGEMPLALQAKLLRFFESGEIQRIGDNETVRVDVRLIAATHQPLSVHAQNGTFRSDLYYRLAVFLIRTPPLSAHMSDLSLLVAHFIKLMGQNSPVKKVDASAMIKLSEHEWPGNVRELEHVLERAAILAGDNCVITATEIDFGFI